MATTDKIILQGGGEHARVVLDCLLDNGSHVVGIFDPKYHDTLFGVKQLGTYQPDFEPNAKAIVAIGDNALRKKVVGLTRHAFTNAIHSSALLSRFVSMKEGCMILHRTVVQAQTKIGSHVIINTGARIDHDCIIEDYVHIAPGATLCGTVHVGEGALIGAGAIVIPGIKIGRWAVIGAGSVVIKDVPEYTRVVGNPARIIKQETK